MALAVVDDLEVVQVDEQQRHRHTVATVEIELPVELLLERTMVAQAGQAVVQRVLACLAVEHLQLGLRLGQVIERLQERPCRHHRDQQHDDGEDDEHTGERVVGGGRAERPEVDDAEVGAVVRLPERRRRGRPAGELQGARGALVTADDAVESDAQVPQRFATRDAAAAHDGLGARAGGDGVAGHVDEHGAAADAGRLGRGSEELSQSDLDGQHPSAAAGCSRQLGGEHHPSRAVGPPRGALHEAAGSCRDGLGHEGVGSAGRCPRRSGGSPHEVHLRAVDGTRDAGALEQAPARTLDGGHQ